MLCWIVRDQVHELFDMAWCPWMTDGDGLHEIDFDAVRSMIAAGQVEARPWLTWTEAERADADMHMRRIAYLASEWMPSPDDPISIECIGEGRLTVHDGHHRLRAVMAGNAEGLYVEVSGYLDHALALIGEEGLV